MQTYPRSRIVCSEAAQAVHALPPRRGARRLAAIIFYEINDVWVAAKIVLKYWTKPIFKWNKTKRSESRARRVRKLRAIQGDLCCWCGGPLDFTTLNKDTSASIEHLIPRSEGGDNATKNLRLSHAACNNARHTTYFKEVIWVMRKKSKLLHAEKNKASPSVKKAG